MLLALFPLGSVPAQADGATWTVIDGGRTDAVNVAPVWFMDMRSGLTGVCNVSELIVRFRSGAGLPGEGLIMVTYGTLYNDLPGSGCAGIAGIDVTIHPRGLPWKMDATSYDPQTGTTTGTLTSDDAAGIGAVVTSGDGCEMTVGGPGSDKGEIQAAYTNESVYGDTVGQFDLTGTNMVITSIGPGCDPGLIDVGDEIDLDARYLVSPQQTITSP
ncbi:hypothetical protein AB0C74_17380 [Spirillospora sp. NPDC048832]